VAMKISKSFQFFKACKFRVIDVALTFCLSFYLENRKFVKFGWETENHINLTTFKSFSEVLFVAWLVGGDKIDK
jgi:hypothetical protein